MNDDKYNYWLDYLSSSFANTRKKYWCSLGGLLELYQPPETDTAQFTAAIQTLCRGRKKWKKPHTFNWQQSGYFYLLPELTSEWMERAIEIKKSIQPPKKYCVNCGAEVQGKQRYCPLCKLQRYKDRYQQWYNKNRQLIKKRNLENYYKKKRKEEKIKNEN